MVEIDPNKMKEIGLKPKEGLEAKLWTKIQKTIESSFDLAGAGSAVVEVRPLSNKDHVVYIIPEEGSVIGQIYVRYKGKPKLLFSNERYTAAGVGNFVIRIYYQHFDRQQVTQEKKPDQATN